VTHHTYHELGHGLLPWGRLSDGSVSEFLKRNANASTEHMAFWTLQAMLSTLVEIREIQIKMARTSVETHEQSSGMFTALMKSVRTSEHPGDIEIDVLIQDLRFSGLSVRAKNCIRWSTRYGAVWLSDLTSDLLFSVSGCGATTVAEIMKWKQAREAEFCRTKNIQDASQEDGK